MRVIDIAKAVNEKAKIKIIGIRPGEKLHEQMVSKYDSNSTIEFKDYYKILPDVKYKNILKKMALNGKKVEKNFEYSSDKNSDWMKVSQLRKLLKFF